MAKTDLSKYGLDMTPERFRENVNHVFFMEMAVLFTIDELLLHPESAVAFCKVVRLRLRANRFGNVFDKELVERLPSDVILRALLAHRKSGKAKKQPRG